ncbi:MAG TPA: SRPBCC domain-containing protein, partial [bacterium]
WRASFDGMNETVVRYELAPAGKGTRLTLIHSGFGDRTDSAQNHGMGWPLIMGWLAAHVTRTRSTA